MRDDDLEDLIRELPPRARAGVRAAMRGATDSKASPESNALALARLGATLARGSAPGIGLILGAIEGAVGLLRWGKARKARKRSKARKRGTVQGLIAYNASKTAGRTGVRTGRTGVRTRRGQGSGR